MRIAMHAFTVMKLTVQIVWDTIDSMSSKRWSNFSLRLINSIINDSQDNTPILNEN
jgi:hypothetical protein